MLLKPYLHRIYKLSSQSFSHNSVFRRDPFGFLYFSSSLFSLSFPLFLPFPFPFSPSFLLSRLLFPLEPRAASTLSLCPQVKVHYLLSACQAEGCSPVYIVEMMSELQDYFPVGSLTLWPFLGNFHHHSYYYYPRNKSARGEKDTHTVIPPAEDLQTLCKWPDPGDGARNFPSDLQISHPRSQSLMEKSPSCTFLCQSVATGRGLKLCCRRLMNLTGCSHGLKIFQSQKNTRIVVQKKHNFPFSFLCVI